MLPVQAYEEMKIMLPAQAHQPTGKFLVVNDVWDFDNIGVSRGVPERHQPGGSIGFLDGTICTIVKTEKYLICAECDRGPLGVVCNVTRADGTEEALHLLSIESLSTGGSINEEAAALD